MTNLEVFNSKLEYNKWLGELTESEKFLIMEMLDEVREIGASDAKDENFDKPLKDVGL